MINQSSGSVASGGASPVIVAAALHHFVVREQDLLDAIVELTIERETYREIAKAAIHELHDDRRELRAVREQLARPRDEYRFLREQRMCEAA